MKERIELTSAIIGLVAVIFPLIRRLFERKRVKVFYSWGVDAYTDQLSIMNPTDSTLQIEDWRFVRRKNWCVYEEFRDIGFGYPDNNYLEIPSKSRKVYTFDGSVRGELRPYDKNKHKLYIKIELSNGNRPIFFDLTY